MTPAAARFDPRTTLARPDLAEQALDGYVRASVFRTPQPMHAVVAVADIHTQADPASERIDQLILGEVFDVLDRKGERLWGRARRDGVVGWIDAGTLADGATRPTHQVSIPTADRPLNALISTGSDEGASAIGTFASDMVAVAETLLGVPFGFGARSSMATDCSGLVQQTLYACGLAGPRYSDQQAELGQSIAGDAARRGDLVVWLNAALEHHGGHSALMLDADRVIHATGHHGAVVVETFAQADARCREAGFQAPQFRRITS